MVFGDVLYDGLVICSLHCPVEHSPVLWEPGNHTTVVFALMWSIYLLCCQLTLSCPQLTLQLSSRDYNGKLGGVNCDDIKLFQYYSLENNLIMYHFKTDAFKLQVLFIILKKHGLQVITVII